MTNLRISELPQATTGNLTDLYAVTQDSTGPGTGITRSITAALLAGVIRPAGIFDVTAYGATGNGVTDDTAAIQEAATALAAFGKGILYFPAGTYLVSSGFPLPDSSIAMGQGVGISRILAVTNFPTTTGPAYSFFYNTNWEAPDLASGNSDISVEGFTFDYSWRITGNAFASLKMRYVTNLKIRDCEFYYGGNAIAIRGCELVWVERCTAFEFRNCAWDFWEGPRTTCLRDLYCETSETAQMMNFNPEVSPVATSPLNVTGYRLSVIGCWFKNTEAGVTAPCQLEPLGNRANHIFDVEVIACQFEATYLVCRQSISSLRVLGNSFSNFPDPSLGAIVVSPAPTISSQVPANIVVANNQITDPHTVAGQFGVIWVDAASAVVTGNVITGSAYAAEPFYQGNSRPNHFGNWYEKSGITGRLQQGFAFNNPNDIAQNERSCLAFLDLNGNALRQYMAGNFLQQWSTDGVGAPRLISSIQAANSSSQLGIFVGTSFSSHVRISTDVNLTATGSTQAGAYAIVKNRNVFSVVAVGTGARLPAGTTVPNAGLRIVIWNLGANNLLVYPPTGGTVAGLAVNAPYTFPPNAEALVIDCVSSNTYLLEHVP